MHHTDSTRVPRSSGKVLFCVADLVVAHLTAAVLQAVGAQQRVAVLGAAVTLFNPFTAAGARRTAP